MKILIIEDEPETNDSICRYLRQENYMCEVAHNIREGEDRIAMHEYDCVLLDMTLPDGNGLTIVNMLKEQQKREAIIIISAKNSVDDRVVGLNMGADDYLQKPFHLAELGARISAVIRRKQFGGSKTLNINDLDIDIPAKSVKVNGKDIEFTPKEFELLLFVISNKNRVVTKNAIAEHLSGDQAEVLDNFDFIYAHMKNLKKKLGEAGCRDYIRTIYGLGYKFETYA